VVYTQRAAKKELSGSLSLTRQCCHCEYAQYSASFCIQYTNQSSYDQFIAAESSRSMRTLSLSTVNQLYCAKHEHTHET